MEVSIRGILPFLFRQFQKGKRHGKGRLELENDDMYDGNFDNDEFVDGSGKLNLSDGRVYEG